MIDAYVDDVVSRLPSRQRKDVGAELQALLRDELAGRAGDSGRVADEAMTLDVLQSFGAPDAVAERYSETGPTIIRGADARRFTMWALGGVALQWPVSFYEIVLKPADGEFWGRVGAWWVNAGLAAFWWPGVLVTAAIIGAYTRDPQKPAPAWTPRQRAALDPDRINRGSMAAMLTLYAFAVLFAVALPSVLGGLPEPFRTILAIDPGFLMQRAPLALLGWGAGFAVYVMAFREGRWSRLTHRLSLGIEAAWVVILAVLAFGGPMMINATADSTARGILVLIALVYAASVGLKLRRELIRVPAQPAT